MNWNETIPVWLRWAPLAAASVHMLEEFALPGGFMEWYRRYRGEGVTSVTPSFLVVINAVLLAACCNAAMGAREPANLPLWLGLAALLGSNGVWHIWAAIRSRSYSPGMVTGTLLYIPLAVYGCLCFLRLPNVSFKHGAIAVAIGVSYQAWSAMYHRRRSVAA